MGALLAKAVVRTGAAQEELPVFRWQSLHLHAFQNENVPGRKQARVARALQEKIRTLSGK